jgi:hypothetical protein
VARGRCLAVSSTACNTIGTKTDMLWLPGNVRLFGGRHSTRVAAAAEHDVTVAENFDAIACAGRMSVLTPIATEIAICVHVG